MKKRILRNIWLLFIILVFVSFPVASYADTGPKPSLSIHLVNPPGEPYYLDLLIQDKGTYPNLHDEEKAVLDQDMLALLFSHESEGWNPAIAGGTGAPLWGSLAGEAEKGGMLHSFSYFGVPDTYRIIIVTQSGKVTVSETQTRKAYQDSITYDYATSKVSVPAKTYGSAGMQFLKTLIITLIIEGALLVIFGFSLRKNWKVFLFTNIATQALLALAIGAALISSGSMMSFWIQFPVEIGIIIFETLIYRKRLKERTPGIRSAYAIVANLASWGIGFLLTTFIL